MKDEEDNERDAPVVLEIRNGHWDSLENDSLKILCQNLLVDTGAIY